MNQHAVRVGIAAKAVPQELKPVAELSDARGQRHFLGCGWGFHRSNNRARNATSSALNRGVDLFCVQRRHEHGSPGRVCLQGVPIGELHRHSGRKASVDIEDRQRGVFTAYDFAGHDQDARAGGGRRFLCGKTQRHKWEQRSKQPKHFQGLQGDGHPEIVVEILPGQKAGRAFRCLPFPYGVQVFFRIGCGVSVRYRKVISWKQSLSERQGVC